MRPFAKWITKAFPRFFLILLLLALTPPRIQAAELKLEVKLIWGTNDETSPDPTHKMVDKATAEKLRKVFKWKNYFLVNRQTATVPSRSTRQIPMSKKCTLEITELQGPVVEVTLIGEGKPVNKTKRPLTKGECFTIGGEDKNGCAWFLLVTELDEK
jgi:hypothetical protein